MKDNLATPKLTFIVLILSLISMIFLNPNYNITIIISLSLFIIGAFICPFIDIYLHKKYKNG